jgi:hypothetical protein
MVVITGLSKVVIVVRSDLNLRVGISREDIQSLGDQKLSPRFTPEIAEAST